MAFPDRSAGYKLVQLIKWIAHGEYPSLETIQDRFGCSRRTAERYIERVRDFVADDLAYDRTRRGYWFAQGGPKLANFRLTEGEAAAVFLATRLFEQCRGTPYEDAVAGALSKLACLFPEEVSLDRVPSPAGWVSFRMEPLRGEEHQVMDVFLRLQEARTRQETVRIHYFTASRGEWSQREVDPYHLRFYDGAWYVIAYCHWRGEVKMFALDRVSDLEPTGRRFELLEGFSIERFLADSFRIEVGTPTDVAIAFGPEQARYVRGKQWHASQRLEDRPDGGLVLRLRVGGLGEVKRWVLSFGAGAEVLEPEGLREEMRGEVDALRRRYGDGG